MKKKEEEEEDDESEFSINSKDEFAKYVQSYPLCMFDHTWMEKHRAFWCMEAFDLSQHADKMKKLHSDLKALFVANKKRALYTNIVESGKKGSVIPSEFTIDGEALVLETMEEFEARFEIPYLIMEQTDVEVDATIRDTVAFLTRACRQQQ